MLFAVIEISLCVSAFYISYAINKASKEHVEHEHQAYVIPASSANVNNPRAEGEKTPTVRTAAVSNCDVGRSKTRTANMVPVNFLNSNQPSTAYTHNPYQSNPNRKLNQFSPFPHSAPNYSESNPSDVYSKAISSNPNNYHGYLNGELYLIVKLMTVFQR